MSSKNWSLSNLQIPILLILTICFCSSADAHLEICHAFPWMSYSHDYKQSCPRIEVPISECKTALAFRISPVMKECWLVNCMQDDDETDCSMPIQDAAWEYPWEPYHWIEDSRINRENLIIPDTITYKEIKIPVKGIKSNFNDYFQFYTDPAPSFTLPNTLEYIYNSFNSSPALTSIKFPNSLKIIEYSFNYIDNVEEFLFPDSLEYICNTCFNYTNCKSFVFPESLRAIGEDSFRKNDNLRTISFNDNLISIGKYSFSELGQLTSLTLPESLAYIGQYAFCGLPELTTLEIKSHNYTLFYKNVFHNCPNIQTIIMDDYRPFIHEPSCFKDVDFDTCVLMVPPGAEENYRNTPGWDRFKNIIANPAHVNSIIENVYVEILPDKSIHINGYGIVDIYSIDGRKIGSFTSQDSPVYVPAGTYIVKTAAKSKKIVL